MDWVLTRLNRRSCWLTFAAPRMDSLFEIHSCETMVRFQRSSASQRSACSSLCRCLPAGCHEPSRGKRRREIQDGDFEACQKAREEGDSVKICTLPPISLTICHSTPAPIRFA